MNKFFIILVFILNCSEDELKDFKFGRTAYKIEQFNGSKLPVVGLTEEKELKNLFQIEPSKIFRFKYPYRKKLCDKVFEVDTIIDYDFYEYKNLHEKEGTMVMNGFELVELLLLTLHLRNNIVTNYYIVHETNINSKDIKKRNSKGQYDKDCDKEGILSGDDMDIFWANIKKCDIIFGESSCKERRERFEQILSKKIKTSVELIEPINIERHTQ